MYRHNSDFLFGSDSEILLEEAKLASNSSLILALASLLSMRGERDAVSELFQSISRDWQTRAGLAKLQGKMDDALSILQAEAANQWPVEQILLASKCSARRHEDAVVNLSRSGRDFWRTPSFHAFYYREAQRAIGGAAESLAKITLARDGSGARSKRRLVGIAKFRNEGEKVRACVTSLLAYCERVVVYDDRSVDGCCLQLASEFGDRVDVSRNTSHGFNEQKIYDYLFAQARRRGATHIMHLDADELLASRLASCIDQIIATLEPGEAFSAPWTQVYDERAIDFGAFRSLPLDIKGLPPYKDVIYCDDGAAIHHPLPIHNPWIPAGYPLRRMISADAEAGIVHLERANPENGRIKTDWYITQELTTYDRSFDAVVGRYSSRFLLDVLAPGLLSPSPDYQGRLSSHAKLDQDRIREVVRALPALPEEVKLWYLANDYVDAGNRS